MSAVDPTACAEGGRYGVGQRLERPCTACGHPLSSHRLKRGERPPCPLCEFEVRLRAIEAVLPPGSEVRYVSEAALVKRGGACEAASGPCCEGNRWCGKHSRHVSECNQ